MLPLLPLLRYGSALGLCVMTLCLVQPARAEDAAALDEDTLPAPHEPLGAERYRTPAPGGGRYFHAFGSAAVGDGIRFNNPYRLSRELGNSAESLSLTASYVDLGLGLVYGRVDALQHGGVLHLSIADVGIPQEVLSLSYVALQRLGSGRTLLFGRAGIPVVLQPDLTGGLEAAVGGAFMLTAGIGVTAEVIGDVYYGAGTVERSVSTIPVLSGQLGLFFDYEVL